MVEREDPQADVSRLTRLKELAGLGLIGGRSSYFNHLIAIYGNQVRTSTIRTFTDRERKRIDSFLATFAN